MVGWLPMYHDMGLIGTVLNPLYAGYKSVLMEPITFLRHPYNWLKVISDYAGTTSGGPNFAYDYCVNRITSKEKATLDLSSWVNAFNGSEKVQSHTIKNFSRNFRECGFRRDSFLPCYGLAESTLFATGKRHGMEVRECTFDKYNLTVNDVKSPATKQDAIKLVNCGISVNSSIRIVDPDTKTSCPKDKVGEIWITGPHITKGYYGKQKLTEETFQARIKGEEEATYLRTGDLGFLQDNELYVAGRIKEMIIIRGRNYYPQDIELMAQKDNPVLRTGAGAAFGIEMDNDEKVILVQEIHKKYVRQLETDFTYATIRTDLISGLNLEIHEIVLVKQGSIPLTSSGKIRRQLVKADYLNNNIPYLIHREMGSTSSQQYWA
jgi:acyl-CoA synthetase (AMP-forming)/AMP-acid ligase II